MKLLFKEIAATIRNYRLFKSFPDNELSREGLIQFKEVLSREECESLIKSIQSYDLSKSHVVEKDCYIIKRGERQTFDKKVVQVINVDHVNSQVAQILHRLRVDEKLKELTGQSFDIMMTSAQVDYKDTETKRGFHVDAFNEPWFKAFIYLNDVEVSGDGPLTVVPRSHFSIGKIILNIIWNNFRIFIRKARPENRDDMSLFFKDKNSVQCFGKAGTMTLANVSCIHKGWGDQHRQDRYMLMLQATPQQFATMRKNIFSPDVKLKKYGIQV